MTALLQKLLKPLIPNATVTAVVISATDTRTVVRTKSGSREVASVANVKYSAGDTVKMQGDIIVSSQIAPVGLTTYQV